MHRQHPRPRGQAQNRTAAKSSQIKFFHSMWTNLFAVAGSRGHPLAGVIRKRGLRPPLVRLSRAATLSASYELAHTARRVVAQASFSCRCATIHLLAPYGMDRVTTLFPLLKGDVWRVGASYESACAAIHLRAPYGINRTTEPFPPPVKRRTSNRARNARPYGRLLSCPCFPARYSTKKR